MFFRIWSHGLQSHQRKSALWHYLYKFGRTNEKLLRFKGTLGVQAYCVPLINSKPYILPDHSRPIQVVIDPKVRKNSFDSGIDYELKLLKMKIISLVIRVYNLKFLGVDLKIRQFNQLFCLKYLS